jgi:hypothetical protein
MTQSQTSTRAAALAERFEKAIDELVAAIEKCSDAQWSAETAEEGWRVCATACHVGAQFPLELEYISAVAENKPMPGHSWDDIHKRNAGQAERYASASREEAIGLLRDGRRTMGSYVRGLSDEQLDRTAQLALADGATVTTQALIEGGVLIAHAEGHLASIRNAG